MYEVYIDGTMFPVAPESIKIEIPSQNKTVNLINGEQMNLIRSSGLHKVSFKVVLPYNKYPYVSDEALSINEYLDMLEAVKLSMKPVDLQILCLMPDNSQKFEYNHKATLEDYSITESTDLGLDTEVDLEFLQYVIHGTQRAFIMNFYVGKEYKIKEGDTLTKIAKKKMGDDEYIEQNAEAIYKHNKSILIASAHAKGLKCLKGKNLVVGTTIIIPWHVMTPEEDRYKIKKFEAGVVTAKKTTKSTDKNTVKKKKQSTVTSNKGKKTSKGSINIKGKVVVGKIDLFPVNGKIDLFPVNGKIDLFPVSGKIDDLSPYYSKSNAVTVTGSDGKQHTIYR